MSASCVIPYPPIKISARTVQLKAYFGTNLNDPVTQARFVLRLPSGSYFYGSITTIPTGSYYVRNFSFASSVTGWVQWWAQEIEGGVVIVSKKGNTFYVPM